MSNIHTRRIVIAGAGIAGWSAGAFLAAALRGTGTSIHVIHLPEDDASLALEGGESTLPEIRLFHRSLGLSERDLLRATRGTFKLGTHAEGWNDAGTGYFAGLGGLGARLDGIAFHQHWLRLRKEAPGLSAFSLSAVAARAGKFAFPEADGRSIYSTLDYGLHLDATAYRSYLRSCAQYRGVTQSAGSIAEVSIRDNTIESLLLDTGERIQGDLFLDCSAARAVLIRGAMGSDYEDWSPYLPCDRIVTVDSPKIAVAAPYTHTAVRTAGWQWRIPLQHRTSHGYVYSSRFTSDDDAAATLMSHVDSTPLREPVVASFVSGCRRKFWIGNCVALGLAAGCVEPLASTGLHLIHRGLTRLVSLFPYADRCELESEEYNLRMRSEYERIRDLVTLHYHANSREGAFWKACRALLLPEPLAHKLEVFRANARIVLFDEECFQEDDWACAFIGLQLWPRRVELLAETLDLRQVRDQLKRMHSAIQQAAHAMPSHEAMLARFIQGHRSSIAGEPG